MQATSGRQSVKSSNTGIVKETTLGQLGEKNCLHYKLSAGNYVGAAECQKLSSVVQAYIREATAGQLGLTSRFPQYKLREGSYAQTAGRKKSSPAGALSGQLIDLCQSL